MKNVLNKLSFKDPKIFSKKKTLNLISNYIILKSCSITPLMNIGIYLSKNILLKKPFNWIIKNTYWKHFVAGSTLEESIKKSKEISKMGLNTILDYSIENIDENINRNFNILIESIKLSEKNNLPFSCFKITALASPYILLKMSKILNETIPDWFDLENSNDYLGFIYSLKTSNAKSSLTNDDLKNYLLPLFIRLEHIGKITSEYNLSILIDAEQSYYQKAINFISHCLMKRYNKNRPIFYNTYQLYLKNGLNNLKNDLQKSKNENYILGAKLVRGAYMDAELKWSIKYNIPYPIFLTIEETHKSYNDAIELMINENIVIATHNEDSIIKSSNLMYKKNIKTNSKNIYFSQLYGMCDNISLTLANNNYNVCKYVPFGEVEDSIPYLLRRIQENKGILSTTKDEQKLILKELINRLI